MARAKKAGKSAKAATKRKRTGTVAKRGGARKGGARKAARKGGAR